MKKIISLILSGIMLCAAISVSAEDTVTLRTELAQLSDMGIMVDVGSGPYQNITRAEMAKAVTQVLNMSNITMATSFSDVTADNPYANEIGVVQSMKIMCGYGNGIFKPDADITYYEAVKTIVALLGYEPIALQKGGYPQGYLKIANEIGLILYPAAEDAVINKNDIAKILLKATETPLMQQISFGSNAEYQISEETLKTKYLGIK